MADNKTKPTKVSVAEFLKSKASAEKLADCRKLTALFKSITGKPGKMWGPSIVGFGSYHYVYDSGREGDAPLLGFAVRGKDIVLYVLTSGAKALLKRLGKHRASVACVYIKGLADIDLAVLEKIARASVDETRARYPAKSAR